MENYTTEKKKNVVQISVFVLPEEKKLIEGKAQAQSRSISNYCKMKILEAEVPAE